MTDGPMRDGFPEFATEDEEAAYERYLLEEWLEHLAELGQVLAMPLPREREANRCDRCREFPTADNPATTYPGQPADLENGPHPSDLPYTLCERCEDQLSDLGAF